MIPTGETKLKLMVTLQSPFNKLRTINMCRSSEDTIKKFVDRLTLKLTQSQLKVSECVKLKKNCVLIKVNGIEVTHTSKCNEIFEKIKENITLQIKDHTYKVIVNAPIINEFKLGCAPYQGLMIYPSELDQGYNVSVMKTQYTWYRIKSKDEIEVGNKMIYIPTAEDVDCHLKLVCNPFNDEGQSGPTAEITTLKVLENTIKLYPFENRLKTKPCNR